jgi:hypothetical protein
VTCATAADLGVEARLGLGRLRSAPTVAHDFVRGVNRQREKRRAPGPRRYGGCGVLKQCGARVVAILARAGSHVYNF